MGQLDREAREVPQFTKGGQFTIARPLAFGLQPSAIREDFSGYEKFLDSDDFADDTTDQVTKDTQSWVLRQDGAARTTKTRIRMFVMKCQGWAISLICLFIAALGSGCACVDSCCTSTCDFGGCGCTQTCGSHTQPVVDTIGQASLDWQAKVSSVGQSCGGGCCGGGCHRRGALSCANWGRRENFVDGCGQPATDPSRPSP